MPRRRWQWAWLALYPLAWVALFAGSTIYWFLPAGLRLGMLWVLPRRHWWKLALVEWAGILALSLGMGTYQSPIALVASTALPWCIYALALGTVGRHGRDVPSHAALPRLLMAGLVGAMFATIALTAIDLNDDGVLPAGLGAMLFTYALGDFAGIVMVLPVLLALRDQWGHGRRPWGDWFAHGAVLAPLAIALALSSLPVIEAPVYPLVLSLFPVFAVSYRFGWQPGAVSLALLGMALHVVSGPLTDSWRPGELQMLVAVSGCAALLLGVTSETQRAQRGALATTVQALSRRGVQLSDAARRIVALMERERRRIGSELHDQLGQDMTAIATRLRVVERSVATPAAREGLASIGQLLADAQDHLREVINHLHPAMLDRFGLARTIAKGPFAEMLRDLGIEYGCTIEGDVAALPDAVATAIYRICQEATNNSARHGCGGRVHIHLTLLAGSAGYDLSLRIEDDAGPIRIDPRRTGRGLQNIHDRADAIGASYRFDRDSGHPRHLLTLGLSHLDPVVESASA